MGVACSLLTHNQKAHKPPHLNDSSTGSPARQPGYCERPYRLTNDSCLARLVLLHTKVLHTHKRNLRLARSHHNNLISSNYLVSKQVSIIALQEPTIDNNGYTLASREWVAIYPTLHQKPNTSTRAVTLIHVSLNPDMWEQVNFPSADIVVIQLHREWGKVTIVNVYNCYTWTLCIVNTRLE